MLMQGQFNYKIVTVLKDNYVVDIMIKVPSCCNVDIESIEVLKIVEIEKNPKRINLIFENDL